MVFKPRVLCIGDVNNDKRDDLIVLAHHPNYNNVPHRVYVYLQDDNGGLLKPVFYPFARVPYDNLAINVADVNNDGLNDVIIGYGDSVGVLYQSNAGVLNSIKGYYSGKNVLSIKTGDLNNDGLTDIAASHSGDSFVSVFHQQVNGLHKNTFISPFGGNELEIADVNSDGLNDVVLLVKQGDYGIHILTQDTNKKLSKSAVYKPGESNYIIFSGIAAGDFNNDGAIDVVATRSSNSPNAKIYIYYQDTITKLLKPAEIIQAMEVPQAIEAADLNCDGKPEIFIAHGGWPYVTVFQQNTIGKYQNYDQYKINMESHINPQGISFGDINNDFKKDIVTIGYGNKIQLLYNDSKVSHYNNINTIVKTDTIFTADDTLKQSYYTVTYDTIGRYAVKKAHLYQVISYYRNDSVKVDTTIIRSICPKPYFDTIKTSHFTSYRKIIKQDTVLISTTMDSLFTDPQLSGGFDCYPNPTSGKLFLEINNIALRESDVYINVYDSKSRLVQLKVIYNGMEDKYLDLYGLSQGMYYIAFRFKSSVYTRKIVKINPQ